MRFGAFFWVMLCMHLAACGDNFIAARACLGAMPVRTCKKAMSRPMGSLPSTGGFNLRDSASARIYYRFNDSVD